MLIRMHFQAYPASKKLTFTCSVCGAPKRSKTIRHECTVNPFSKNERGEVRTPQEVRQLSTDLVARDAVLFMKEPVCSKCDADMSYAERKALRERREAAE